MSLQPGVNRYDNSLKRPPWLHLKVDGDHGVTAPYVEGDDFNLVKTGEVGVEVPEKLAAGQGAAGTDIARKVELIAIRVLNPKGGG